jgi:hypothetical protein
MLVLDNLTVLHVYYFTLKYVWGGVTKFPKLAFWTEHDKCYSF